MSIPLKAKVAIRDQWETPDSPVQKAAKELEENLGLKLNCSPQWPTLIAELDSVYQDKGELITYVISSVRVWLSVLGALVDNAEHEEWAEQVVDKVKDVAVDMNLYLDITSGSQPTSVWSDERRGFVVSLPKSETSYTAQFSPIFQDHLLGSFESKAPVSLPIQSTTGDEWADVGADVGGEDLAVSAPSIARPGAKAARELPRVDFLPDPNTLPRPVTLLMKPPYHMFIKTGTNDKNQPNTWLEIQCSHTPTLEFLHRYLKKWCAITPGHPEKVPVITLKLNQGQSSFGLPYDTLHLTSEYRYAGIYTISPTMILHLVEAVLGYDRVFEDYNSWQYRRDSPYKTM